MMGLSTGYVFNVISIIFVTRYSDHSVVLYVKYYKIVHNNMVLHKIYKNKSHRNRKFWALLNIITVRY